jgi:hypothetical protein
MFDSNINYQKLNRDDQEDLYQNDESWLVIKHSKPVDTDGFTINFEAIYYHKDTNTYWLVKEDRNIIGNGVDQYITITKVVPVRQMITSYKPIK